MKTALVTGGSRGIGKAICVRLAAEGYHIIINYVSNDEAAQKTLEEVIAAGGTGELMKFDVSDHEATVSAVNAWQSAHPEEFIEVLVNNAGIRRDNLLLWMEQEDWFKVMKTNLDSFYNVTRPVLQPMVVHKRGRIINMASLSGQKGRARPITLPPRAESSPRPRLSPRRSLPERLLSMPLRLDLSVLIWWRGSTRLNLRRLFRRRDSVSLRRLRNSWLSSFRIRRLILQDRRFL